MVIHSAMSSIYYGKIGKDNGWALASDTPIVVFINAPANARFVPAKTIEEAGSLVTSDDDKAYVWNNGQWEETQFLATIKRANYPTKIIKGFQP